MKNPYVPRLSKLGLLSVLAVTAALGACRPDMRAQRILDAEVVLNVGGDPKTLDPHLVVDTVASRAVMTFIRGMTMIDTAAQPYPEMAERWEVSPDGRVYDFYLRETEWSNGEPVSAEDFEFAWINRVLDPRFGSEYAYMMYDYIDGAKPYYEAMAELVAWANDNYGQGKYTIEQALADYPGTKPDRSAVGIEVVGPRHLRVRLTGPAPFFAQLTAHHTYFPVCKSVAAADPDWALGAETYVSNGPFTMAEFVPGERLVGVRNEHYWNAENVAMRRLTFRFIEEETTERIAFDTGELDGTYLVPRPDIESLRESPELRIAPMIGTYYLNFNMPLPLFADLRVRRALALAVDRSAIVRNVARAGEEPAYSLVPPQLYDRPGKAYVQDARYDEARRLLAEAGYPGGEGFPKIAYLYNTLEVHKAIAQVLQETWKRELGIELALENQEFKVVIENRNQGNFEMARNGWVADFADPINFLEIFLSYSGNNNSHWHDEQFDAMLDAARRESDPAKRLELLRDAEDRLMADLPIIPIYRYAHPYLGAEELEGYDVTPMNTIDVAKLKWRK